MRKGNQGSYKQFIVGSQVGCFLSTYGYPSEVVSGICACWLSCPGLCMKPAWIGRCPRSIWEYCLLMQEQVLASNLYECITAGRDWHSQVTCIAFLTA